MRGVAPISRIYALGEPGPIHDPERVFSRIWRWCRDLWVVRGTIVARPEELPEHLRGPMVAWAEETYGRRRNGQER